jgi:SH3-like domain-containing protein
MMRTKILLAALAITLPVAAPADAQVRTVPYWASIAASEAMMRTGPDRTYPAVWIYKRKDLPLRVIQINGAWRRVQEQDGTTGWMLASLLAARRTAIVTGTFRPIREARDDGSRLLWQAAPGVVGRISKCDGQYCRIQIGERAGYIQQGALWGTGPGEQIN